MQGAPNFIVIGLWIFLQQRHKRHHDTRRTEPALKGTPFDEGALYWMQVIRIAQALDGLNAPPLRAAKRHQTRTDGAAIHQHRAGTAFPVATTNLRSPKLQMITQKYG